RWSGLLLSAAPSDSSPWRQQFLAQEFLDTYSGRYYHLRALDASSGLTLEQLAADHAELAERFRIQSVEDLQRAWREAARFKDTAISQSLRVIGDDYRNALRDDLTLQIVELLRKHPAYPPAATEPGSARAFHDVLSDIGGETVNALDQSKDGT